MRINSKTKNKWGLNVLQNIKDFPGYVAEKVYPTTARRAKELTVKYGPVLNTNTNMNEVLSTVKGLLDRGDEISAIKYIKEKRDRLRKQNNY